MIDILMQRYRNKGAAKNLLRKPLKSSSRATRVMATDKMKSYSIAKKGLMSAVKHRQHQELNN